MLDALVLICIAGSSLILIVTVTYYGKLTDSLRAERDEALAELECAIDVITGLNKPAAARLRAVK